MPSKIPADNKRAAVAGFGLKALSAAVLSALLVANAGAAGLGRLTVLSGLGQPLRAEIELNAVSKDEVGALVAKLASADAFRQANIDFNAALLSLRFDIEYRGERQFIRVSSTQPLNEPFVDMLLELNGPHGRLIREYTFLLDPPELRGTQAAAVAPVPVPKLADTPASAGRTAPAAAAPTAPNAPTATVNARAQSAPAAVPREGAEEYRVRQGDTLRQIANQVKPAGVSLDQMLVALFQSNPEAFSEKNMNRLRAGEILSVPTAETAAAIDAGTARSTILAQAADFNAYRQRLAGQVAAAAAQQGSEGRQGGSGRITAQVEERASPANEARDRLQLSQSAPGSGSAGGGAEDAIAQQKAREEAESRIRELERIVAEQKKLLDMQSANLAAQQKQAEAAMAAAAQQPAPQSQPQQAQQQAQPQGESVAETKPAETNSAPAAAAPKPAPAVAPKPAPVQPEPPSLLDDVLSNPVTLPGLGALLLALAGLGIYRARRNKTSKQFEDSIITDSSLKANSLFGSTGGQSVDTNNSVFNSNFSPSVSQLDSNEVDPVAEADVYIAYGRDAQAEEILKEALRTQPDRLAVRVKLLEIYSNRKDLRGFEVVATELYSLTKGEGEEWAQAAEMGVALDPNNPLYASAKEADAASGDVPEAGAESFNDDSLSTLLSVTQGNTTAMGAIASLEGDTAYFSNTETADESVQVQSAPAEGLEAESSAPLAEEVESNEIEFKLDDMNLGDMNLDVEVPNTIPRPASAEPSAELASIDFDFLDSKAQQDEPKVELAVQEDFETDYMKLDPEASAPAAEHEGDADTMSSLDALELALNEMSLQVPETPPAEPEAASSDLTLDIGDFDIGSGQDEIARDEGAQDAVSTLSTADDALAADSGPMDFDLSDISLELDPGQDKGAAAPAIGLADDNGYGASEMATKLDLAIAYQEIGDKEGARELLDEVLKGGTPEQSEKAKSLLLELA